MTAVAPGYWGYPPEFNSFLLSSGVGSGTWLNSHMSWAGFSGLIKSVTAELDTIVGGMKTQWHGAAPEKALTEVKKMIDHLSELEKHAHDSGHRCDAVTQSYSRAVSKMPPLQDIQQNRANLSQAVANRDLPGINHYTEEYQQMWQTAAEVMTEYDKEISHLTQPSPLPKAPPLTHPGGKSPTSQKGGKSLAKDAAKGNDQMMQQMMQMAQQAPQMAQQMMQPLQQLAQQGPKQLEQLTKPAQKMTEQATKMAQQFSKGGQGSSDASENLGDKEASKALRAMHYGHHMGGGGSPSSWGSSGGLSTGRMPNSSGAAGVASLSTPGNTRVLSGGGSPGAMGGGGMGGAARGAGKKDGDRTIERKFLDDVDAYGNFVDDADEEFSEHDLRAAIQKYT